MDRLPRPKVKPLLTFVAEKLTEKKIEPASDQDDKYNKTNREKEFSAVLGIEADKLHSQKFYRPIITD
jgi:hypothetical protein